jgi:HEAT repeat protein
MSKAALFLAPVILSLTACTTPVERRADPDSQMVTRLPLAMTERLISSDIRQRISVLDEMVVYRTGDVLGLTYRGVYSPSVYSQVLGAILVDDLRRLEKPLQEQAIAKCCFAITGLKLKDLAPALIRLLPGSETNAQWAILEALQATGAKAAIPQVTALLDSPDWQIRRLASETLVSFRAREVVPYLTGLLRDPATRASALMSLAAVGDLEAAPAIAPLLNDPNETARYWALHALAELKAKGYAQAVWQLLERKPSTQTAAYAIAVLVAFGEERAVPLAVAKATAIDFIERKEMLNFLIRLDAKDAVPELISVLEGDAILGGDIGSNSNIRRDVMEGLGRWKPIAAIPMLMRLVEHSKNRFLRDAAVATLGQLRAKEASSVILPLLDKSVSGGSYESANAAIALAMMGDRTAWPHLSQFIQDSTHPRRDEIIRELNYSLDPELWRRILGTDFQGSYSDTLAANLEAMSVAIGVPIYVESGIPKVARIHVNTSVNRIGVLRGLWATIEQLNYSDKARPQNSYTCVIDHGAVHIMPLKDAIRWWQDNLRASGSVPLPVGR